MSYLNMFTTELAKVGEKMVGTGHGVANVAMTSQTLQKGGRLARVAASALPTRELAVMCGRAGVAGGVVDGAVGGLNALNAVRKGRIDGKQAVVHTVAEAGCGFVTSSAGTAGTLAAYMVTGAMGPLAIAAGMGASVGSRHLYRKIVGETLPGKEGTDREEKSEDLFEEVGPRPQD